MQNPLKKNIMMIILTIIITIYNKNEKEEDEDDDIIILNDKEQNKENKNNRNILITPSSSESLSPNNLNNINNINQKEEDIESEEGKNDNIPPSIESPQKQKLSDRLSSKYGPLQKQSSKPPTFLDQECEPGSISMTNRDDGKENYMDNDIDDIMTETEIKEKEYEWNNIDPNWKTAWSQYRCQQILDGKRNKGDAAKEYAKMYQKYWKSINYQNNNKNDDKNKKRKRDDQLNDDKRPCKKQKIDSNGAGALVRYKDVTHVQNELISFTQNCDSNEASDYDSKSSEQQKLPSNQPTITDLWSKQIERTNNDKSTMTEIQRAIAASLESVNNNNNNHYNKDDDDRDLQRALAASVIIKNVNDLVIHSDKINKEKNHELLAQDLKLGNSSNINKFRPICNEDLLPNNINYTQYNLQSIVRHLGTNYQCGHYITDVLSENIWKRHDDQYVSSTKNQIATNDNAQKNAYIFFLCSSMIKIVANFRFSESAKQKNVTGML